MPFKLKSVYSYVEIHHEARLIASMDPIRNIWTDKEYGATLRFLNPTELSRPPLERQLPLVICANRSHDFLFLLKFIKDNKQQILSSIKHFGGVLFRGFDVNNAEDFEKILRTLDFELSDKYTMGTSPRKKVTNYIYTSTEWPARYQIYPHTEMAYLPHRPSWVSFFCLEAPKVYGETPIFNCRTLLKDLRPDVQEILARHKIKYVRNYRKHRSTFALNFGRPWTEVFETADKSIVEDICKKHRTRFTWSRHDSLRTETITPPIVKHPETNDLCLNMIPAHWAAMLKNFQDIGDRHNWFVLRFYQLLWLIKPLAGAENLKIYFENDEPIPTNIILHILEGIHQHSVIFPWKQGDVLIIDNRLTGHSRLNVIRPRRILAAFGNMYDLPDS